MAGNISQSEDGTFAGLMSIFDLASNDKFDSRATKIPKMHVVCGLKKDPALNIWCDFSIKVVVPKNKIK